MSKCPSCEDRGTIQMSFTYDCFICEQYGNDYKNCTLCNGTTKYTTYSVRICDTCNKFEDKLGDNLSKL